MALFSIQWRSSTKKDIRALPRHEVARIITVVTKLASEPLPHGSQKITGSEPTFRIRVGDCRVIYEVFSDANLIEIQYVRHRKDVYRR